MTKADLIRKIDEFITAIKELDSRKEFSNENKYAILDRACLTFAISMRQYFITIETLEQLKTART